MHHSLLISGALSVLISCVATQSSQLDIDMCLTVVQQTCTPEINNANVKASALNIAAGNRSIQTVPKTPEVRDAAGTYCKAVTDTYRCMLRAAKNKCNSSKAASHIKINLKDGLASIHGDPQYTLPALHTYCERMKDAFYGNGITIEDESSVVSPTTMPSATIGSCADKCATKFGTDASNAIITLQAQCSKHPEMKSCLKQCNADQSTLATCSLPEVCADAPIFVKPQRTTSIIDQCAYLEDRIPCFAFLINVEEHGVRKQEFYRQAKQLESEEEFRNSANEDCKTLVADYIAVIDGKLSPDVLYPNNSARPRPTQVQVAVAFFWVATIYVHLYKVSMF